MRAPPADQRIWTSPSDPNPDPTPLEAQNLAAHFLWRYCGDDFRKRADRLSPKPRTSIAGWDLPQWTTKTPYLSPFDRARTIWHRVLQLANDESIRIALRDTCKTFKQLSSDFDFERLNLQRVAFDARNPKRIFVLDYVAVKSPFEPGVMLAYHVLREIPPSGRERRKVLLTSSIFFEVHSLESFKKPPYVSSLDWSGEYLHHTRETGVKTPSGHVLAEQVTISDTIVCGRSGKDHDEGKIQIERWTSSRNLKTRLLRLADDKRKTFSLALKAEDLDYCRRLNMWHAQKGKKGRGPCPSPPPDPDREEVMAWERESLDGEGLDDHFTLQAIAEIVTGRFRSQSAAYTNWSDGYSTVSSAWESKGPLYILLNPHVEGFMPMYAPFPAIEDALKGRLGLPSWAQDSRAPKMDIDAMRALLLFTSLKR